jgi:hypothetical protein
MAVAEGIEESGDALVAVEEHEQGLSLSDQ